MRPFRILVLLLVLAVIAPACTGGETPSSRAGQPTTTDDSSPSPESPTARVQAPGQATTIVAGTTPTDLALGTSGALFAEAPVAVVAAADDGSALAQAASVAVGLGAPLLLAATPPGPTPSASPGEPSAGASASAPASASASATPTADAAPVVAELDRLGTRTVLVVGSAAAEWAESSPEISDDREVINAPADPQELADLAGVAAPAGRSGTPQQQLTAVTQLDRTEEAQPEDDRLAVTPPDPLRDVVVLATPDTPAVAAAATARAAGAAVIVLPDPDPRASQEAIAALTDVDLSHVVALGDAFGEPAQLRTNLEVAATGVQLPGGGQLALPGKRYVALYGHPGDGRLGVLGEQGPAESVQRAQEVAAPYAERSDLPVVPTFEIITTVASSSAGPDGDYSAESEIEHIKPYVDAAREAGVYAVLDLQPGRTDFLTQAKRYTELLAEPHVGLALDPEWRLAPGQRHLEQIGSVSADEVNAVLDWLAQLTAERRLPQKLVVLHQFRLSMIQNRERLDTSHDELAVLIQMDGNGSPDLKFQTWGALRSNAPQGVYFGWKNFYDEDSPTFTPAETLAIEPTPWFISYQ